MQRILLLTPIFLIVLTLLGFPSAVARMLEPAPIAIASAANQRLGLPGPAGARPADAAAVPGVTPGAVRLVASASAADVVAIPALAATPLARPSGLLVPVAPSPTASPAPSAPAPSATATPPPPTATTIPPTATALSATATVSTALSIPVTGEAPRRTGTERPPQVNAREIVVVDGDSGAVLFEQNAHRRVAPASVTKIVTALVALGRKDWSEMVTADFDQSELIDSTLMGLRQGDRVSLEDLLYGLMLPSGNDAALAIASHVAGSKPRFVEMMNDLARDLGLVDSHFANPHGLDAPGHYSSAYDLVQFARYGMRDPRFQALSAARMRTVQAGARTYDIYNLNRLLGRVPGADGVKIGYTEDAGRTIVASVTRNGHRVYVGAFHISDQIADCRPLFEWAFRNFTWTAPTGATTAA